MSRIRRRMPSNKCRQFLVKDISPTKANLKQLVKHWSKIIGAYPKEIQVQGMKDKWASCSSSGRITFSTDLLLEDADFCEYVIVHELVHLLIPNHGKLFKTLFNAYINDHEIFENRLKYGVRK